MILPFSEHDRKLASLVSDDFAEDRKLALHHRFSFSRAVRLIGGSITVAGAVRSRAIDASDHLLNAKYLALHALRPQKLWRSFLPSRHLPRVAAHCRAFPW